MSSTPNTVTGYKLAKPSGWDFRTGNTVNYRGDGKYPHVVKCPNADAKKGLCSDGVIHASAKPNDCFVGASIPCSAYKVQGIPVCGDDKKWGFTEFEVLEEITDLDALFGWKYSEAVKPINPLTGRAKKPTEADIELLKKWASVRDSVRDSVEDSVRDSVEDSVWASVRDSVWASVWASVRDSVWASVGDSVWASVGDSVWASVWAYIGSLFPCVVEWRYIEHEQGVYPYQPCADLWKRGFVPSYDGKVWRLHSGKSAKVVWEGKI